MIELKSHPDKLLIDHLQEVANKAVALYKDKHIFLPVPQPVFLDLLYTLGALHDVGKATGYFQQYLICNIEPEKCKQPVHSNLKNHALPSAIFTFWYLKNHFACNQISEYWQKIIPFLGYVAVRRHHGNLNNLEDEFSLSNEQVKDLKKQIQSIDGQTISNILASVLKKTVSWQEFVEFMEKESYNDDFEEFTYEFLSFDYGETDEQTKTIIFYFFSLLYASLLLADKQDVILDKKTEFATVNTLDKIAQFRKIKGFDNPKTQIDKLKNQAYFTTLENLEKVFKPDTHLYSVSLPTGLGKTITSLAAAEKLKQLAGLNGSTVINIPFTSIIDQNFEVFNQILQNPSSTILLKHHHLTEPAYKLNDETLNFEQSEFLIETWQSQTIVTTFVQLLEAILTTRKKDLLKLPCIVNSVIVLDEVQTIPYKLWPAIRQVFQTIGQIFNTYFIFVTATQPFIFKPGEEIFELVPEHNGYFNIFNRTKLIIGEEVEFHDYKNQLLEYIENNPSKNILAILNTKKAAYETFAFLSDVLSDNVDLLYLTTYITPYERKKIINHIKENTGKQKVIVSTQLVEAGVDISVDTVFRQIAPLDALIQSAGRANRYSEQVEPAEVFVYKIKELMSKTSLIYGSELIDKTWEIIKRKNLYYETEYLELIHQYFKRVYYDLAKNITPLQLPDIQNLNFAKTNEFYFIEQKYKTESIFVMLNNEAKELWQKFSQIYGNDSLSAVKKREKFAAIKAKFYDYVLNIIIPYKEQTIDIDTDKEYGFYCVDPEISDYYNYNPHNLRQCTGYPAEGKQALFW